MEIQRRSPVKIHVMIPMRRRRDCRVESRPNPDRIPADSDADFRDRFRIDSGAIPDQSRADPGSVSSRRGVGADSFPGRSSRAPSSPLPGPISRSIRTGSAPGANRARDGSTSSPHEVHTGSAPGPRRYRTDFARRCRGFRTAWLSDCHLSVSCRSPFNAVKS